MVDSVQGPTIPDDSRGAEIKNPTHMLAPNTNNPTVRPQFINPTPPHFDLAVIGGGAVGLATAMAIVREYPVRLIVLEAESDLAAHQTGNNSGVIHSGLYYKPGSLKANLCTEGRELMYQFCQENGIAHDRCGKVVVATDESELPRLDELERRGNANGLTGMRRLTGPQIREYEPHVAGIAGLFVRETGIVDYKAVTHAYADVVRRHGGEVHTQSRVTSVQVRTDRIVLDTSSAQFTADALVNCGGLQSDRVARMCGVDPGVQIVPFRGEYFHLADGGEKLIKNLVYPVPDPAFPFLGVHFTRMIGGGVEAGPNAVLALARHGYRKTSFNPLDALGIASYGGFWRMARKHWKTGFGELHRSMSKKAFLKALQRLMPELQLSHLHPGGAGVRAQALEKNGALVDDFKIVRGDRMVHVLNAPSPAATASIAIGRHIAALAAQTFSLRRDRATAGKVTS